MISLVCFICPRNSHISDISNLLAHISSKGQQQRNIQSAKREKKGTHRSHIQNDLVLTEAESNDQLTPIHWPTMSGIATLLH
ncbi:hypothetical protein HD806DRAFT_478085 [Xylariaceae sp. AK1471]|nr:hypothetical protein HD806DRAFT_478085 [Xylariaceae sp. AK1471]